MLSLPKPRTQKQILAQIFGDRGNVFSHVLFNVLSHFVNEA